MTTQQLLYKVHEGIATITMNRPDKYNSVTREMALAMQTAIDRAAEDDAVRVIVLTGSGKAFCAGQDLKEAIDLDMPDLGQIVEQHFNPLVKKMVKCPKPIIAAINGVAAGAGANLAFACDITIATGSAVFIQAFSKIGLIPDSGGTYTLPRLVGHARASALMMLGDKVSAQEAVEMGMIYQAVPDGDFEEVVLKTATKVSKMPTAALALTKEALHHTWTHTLEDQLDMELRLQVTAGNTQDHTEGVTAFVEKRKPSFTGK
jgi:2-(1,2-epoxy-1,2-dihydrophenyl)acetyl-CoA isomerase